MKTVRLPLIAGLTVLALSACAINPTPGEHAAHHPEQARPASATPGTPGPHGMAGQGMMGQGMMQGDMAKMCEMHMAMMQARTPEERRAMMEEHIKNMPPEMRAQHMQMMNMKMQMMREHMDMMREHMGPAR